MPFVRNKNSCCSLAFFFAALSVAFPSSVVGSFMSRNRCMATSCLRFIPAPFVIPNVASLFASSLILRASAACSFLTSSWDWPCFFARRRFSCAGVLPMATDSVVSRAFHSLARERSRADV